MSDNFLPSSDDAFDHFVTDFVAYATANPAACGLSNAQLAALTAAANAWGGTFGDFITAKNAFDVARQTKDTSREGTEGFLRPFIAAIQANVNVTDATRVGLGIPVHKTTHTPIGVPETHPVLYKVDQEHLLQRLWFSDQGHVGKRGKPPGVQSCEIRQALVAPGGAAPTDPGAMPYLCNDTKSPHRTDFEPEDVGKTAYYCQRWQNPKGQPGPWGPVTGWIVT